MYRLSIFLKFITDVNVTENILNNPHEALLDKSKYGNNARFMTLHISLKGSEGGLIFKVPETLSTNKFKQC